MGEKYCLYNGFGKTSGITSEIRGDIPQQIHAFQRFPTSLWDDSDYDYD